MINVSRKYLTWIPTVAFSLLNIILSLRYVGFVMFDQDPWIAIYGAKRILEGQLLYKNFFDFVTPGTDYLLAAIFSIFGLKLTVAHLAVIFSNAFVVFIVVWVSFDIIKNKWLRLLPGLLFSLYSAYVYYVSHHWFILLPVVLALFSGIKNIRGRDTRMYQWLFTGLATAGAFLFIQSIGLTLFGMIVLFLIWYYGSPSPFEKGAGHPSERWVGGIFWKGLMYYISGFLIPLLVVVILFALSGSLSAFIYDSFIWPFSHYRAINLSTPSDILKLLFRELSSNGLILGIIYSFIAYFGILMALIGFVYTVIKFKKNKPPGLSSLAFVAFFCIGIAAGLLPNPPAFHLMVFLSVYMLVIILMFEYAPFWNSRFIRAGFYLYFILITFVILYNTYRFFPAYRSPSNAVETFQTPIGKVKMYKEYKYLPSVSYPYSLLKDLDIELPKHIFVLYWSPSIYLLTGTDNPTPLNTYIPYYNTREQAMSVIHALQADCTKLIIMDDNIKLIKNRIGWLIYDRRIFSRTEPLISYINTHYRLDKVIPGYKIYRLIK